MSYSVNMSEVRSALDEVNKLGLDNFTLANVIGIRHSDPNPMYFYEGFWGVKYSFTFPKAIFHVKFSKNIHDKDFIKLYKISCITDDERMIHIYYQNSQIILQEFHTGTFMYVSDGYEYKYNYSDHTLLTIFYKEGNEVWRETRAITRWDGLKVILEPYKSTWIGEGTLISSNRDRQLGEVLN